MPVQFKGNLLVCFPLKVGCKNLPFQIAEELFYNALYIRKLLFSDDELFRVCNPGACYYVQKGPVGFLFIYGFV